MSSQPCDHPAWRLNSHSNKHIPINVVSSFTPHHINLTTAQSFNPSMPHRPHLPLSPSHHPLPHSQQLSQQQQAQQQQQPQQQQTPPPPQQQQSQQQRRQQQHQESHHHRQPQTALHHHLPQLQQQHSPQQQQPSQQQQQQHSQQQPLRSQQPQPLDQAQSSQQSHQHLPQPHPDDPRASSQHQQQTSSQHQESDPHAQPPHQQSERQQQHISHHQLPLPQHLTQPQPQQAQSSHDASALPQATHLHPTQQHPSHLLPSASSPDPSSQQPQRHTPSQSVRKKQFRFSVRNDIDLLRNVLELNPYGAPHGGRLLKWHTVADTLRTAGIDIDFRRARDRTALLLEQWRAQDFSSRRRAGSGNQQEQTIKEQLLHQLSTIELAAKPRDNLQDWRPRADSASRLRPSDPGPSSAVAAVAAAAAAAAAASSHSSPAALPPDPTSTDHAAGPTHAVIAPAGDAPGAKFPPFVSPSAAVAVGAGAGGSHQPAHIPALVSQDQHVLSHGRSDQDVQFSFPSSQTHHPEKLLKNNQGKRTSPRFSQGMFGGPSTPPNVVGMSSQGIERRSPARATTDLGFRPDVSVFRTSQAMLYRNTNTGTVGPSGSAGGLEVGPVQSSNSGRLGEGLTEPVESQGGPVEKASGEMTMSVSQLQARVNRLEHRLEEEIKLRKQWQQIEDRRWQMAREQETRRLQLEKERMEKEHEERKEEREDRRRREQRDRDERNRLIQMLVRTRGEANMSDPENAD